MASVDPPDRRGGAATSGQGSLATAAPKSFAAAVSGVPQGFFNPIPLVPRQYWLKEGCPSIHFSPSKLQEGSHRLQHSLVAKFSNGRPHIDVVRKAFTNAWHLNGEASIGAWDARHVLIVLKSEQDACRVLASSVRKVQNTWFRLFRWTPDFHSKKEPTITTTWVKLMALPPQMYDVSIIKMIVSSFGKFIGVDERTKKFTNPSFARACVELDLTHSAPEKVWISPGKAEGFWLNLEFQSKLLYCANCRLHGHLISSCRKAKAGSSSSPVIIQIQTTNPNPRESVVVLGQSAVAEKDDGEQEGWQVQKRKKASKKKTQDKQSKGQTSAFGYVQIEHHTTSVLDKVSSVELKNSCQEERPSVPQKQNQVKISSVAPSSVEPSLQILSVVHLGQVLSSPKAVQAHSKTRSQPESHSQIPAHAEPISLGECSHILSPSPPLISPELPRRVWSISTRRPIVYSRAKAKASPHTLNPQSQLRQYVSPLLGIKFSASPSPSPSIMYPP